MTPVRASRLQSPRRKKRFLEDKLPYGSIQRRIILQGGTAVIAFLLAVLIADELVMPLITRHGSEFTLPDFSEQAVFEAQVALGELDLKYEIASEEFSPGREAGIILQQFPIAGTKVKSGRTIKFVVSLGQKMIAIPVTHALSVRQAMLNLETAGLTLGEIEWAVSDTIPERVVVFSYPAAGTEVPLGTPVNLMVNRGRASNFTYMPNLLGLPLSEAEKRLEDKGLKMGVKSYRTDENYLPETVLEQSEDTGAELDVGTEIDVVVSST
jgi:serine/threonine-protein kinase